MNITWGGKNASYDVAADWIGGRVPGATDGIVVARGTVTATGHNLSGNTLTLGSTNYANDFVAHNTTLGSINVQSPVPTFYPRYIPSKIAIGHLDVNGAVTQAAGSTLTVGGYTVGPFISLPADLYVNTYQYSTYTIAAGAMIEDSDRSYIGITGNGAVINHGSIGLNREATLSVSTSLTNDGTIDLEEGSRLVLKGSVKQDNMFDPTNGIPQTSDTISVNQGTLELTHLATFNAWVSLGDLGQIQIDNTTVTDFTGGHSNSLTLFNNGNFVGTLPVVGASVGTASDYAVHMEGRNAIISTTAYLSPSALVGPIIHT